MSNRSLDEVPAPDATLAGVSSVTESVRGTGRVEGALAVSLDEERDVPLDLSGGRHVVLGDELSGAGHGAARGCDVVACRAGPSGVGHGRPRR